MRAALAFAALALLPHSAAAAAAKPPQGPLAAPPKPPPAKPAPAMFKGVYRSAMLKAAKTSPLKLIDYGETYCDGDTPIADWLAQLTAGEAKSIVWTTGPCTLTNTMNPLDSGGDYCVDATIRLKHPQDRHDAPVIEIYLNDPKPPMPGPAYAFRDIFRTGDGPDSDDYERERRTFQLQWRDRFKDAPPPPCEDDQ